ncbi:MAG: transporter substrate-binding domain-containing protein [Deltaproteobacteria bacterium]|nr:transporter substrate-binding domain-containing protein [Deltaproteobacteria bacterium]
MNEHRRLALRALSTLLVLALAGCASQRGEPQPRGLSRILQTGEMRIGMSGEQPPLTMTARSGELLGLDVALSRVLAKAMGVEARFVQLPFGQLLDALENGEVEIVMSGLTITPARTQRVTLVGPYFTSGKTVLTRDSELAATQRAEDLDLATLRFAALVGSTSEEFVRSSLPNATLVPTKHLDEAIQRVMDGEVDALIADRETCSFAVLRHPEAGLIASETALTIEPMGIAVHNDDEKLARLIETYLTTIERTGTLEKARRFWFKDPSWVKELR